MEIILETRECPRINSGDVCVYVNIDGKTQVNGLLEEKRNLMLFILESPCEKKEK